MKECTECGKRKELDEFYKNNATADGKTYRCMECLKSYAKQRLLKKKSSMPDGWKQKTKDIEAYRKEWSDKNPGYYTEKKRESRTFRSFKMRHPNRGRVSYIKFGCVYSVKAFACEP
jgi:hypothetical protein